MTPSLGAFIGFRYLFGKGPNRANSLRRIRGGILGIALSMVPLVVVFEVAEGMIEGITSRFIETWSGHIQMSTMEYLDADGLEESARLMDLSPLVASASAETRGTGLVKAGTKSLPVLIRGVEPRLWSDDPGFRSYMNLIDGSFELGKSDSVVLGEALAVSLNAKVGDKIRLLTYGEQPWAGLPRLSSARVTGIVSSGYQDLDRMWAFVPLQTAGKILSPANTYSFISLKVIDPYEVPNPLVYRTGGITTKGQGRLGWGDFSGAVAEVAGEGWFLSTWYDSQSAQLEHFIGTRTLLMVIMVLIVLVAAVNVSSTMILIVMEKESEIAMLKSLGAGTGDISRIFVLMGSVTGLVGTTLGMSLGIVISLGINQVLTGLEYGANLIMNLNNWFQAILSPQGTGPLYSLVLLNPEFYLAYIPIRLHGGALLGIFLLALVLSALASVLPALRASKLKPLDIFRKV